MSDSASYTDTMKVGCVSRVRLTRCVCGFVHDFGHSLCATLNAPCGLPDYTPGDPSPARLGEAP